MASSTNSSATATTSTAIQPPLLRFAGGLGTTSLAQATAFLAAETGLTIAALPQINGTAAPFATAATFGSAASTYQASALTAASSAATGAPTLSEWTRSAGPGDTIVLAGSNLGSNLHVFVYGQQANGDAVLAEASVVQSESGDATIVLPTSLPAGGVYSLWAANSSGFSAGVEVNAPELWWVGADEAAPGQTVSLYGRNLALSGGPSPTVVLQMTDGSQAGKTFTLSAVQSSAYRVDVQLPTALPDGHYAVYLNNDAGGQSSWSQTQGITLAVRAAVGHDWTGGDSAVINAGSYGAVAGDGKDDAAALQKAVAAARAMITNGGSVHEVTIQLGAGTYDLGTALTLEDGINLQGAGAGKTILEPTAAMATASQQALIWAGTSTMAATATGSRVTGMTLNTQNGLNYTALWGRSAEHLTVDNVDIEAQNGTPFDVAGTSYFTLSNSKVVGESAFIGAARQVTITGNAFYGTNQTGENITGFGASDVNLSNNTAQDLVPNPTASTWQTGTYEGRFYVDQTHSGQPVNQYIAGNATHGLAPYIEYADQGVNTNGGEQILFEGAGETTRLALSGGLFKASTSTSLTLSHSVTPALPVGMGALLTVAAGAGAGATTEVTGYDPTTATFQFADPLNVKLDATSTIILSRAPNQIAVVNNSLDGRPQNVASSTVSASVGVEVYPGGARFAIDGNTFSNLRQAVSLWSFPATKDDPGMGGDNSLVGVNFFDIKNNTVVNSNVGIDFHDDPGGAADLKQPAAIVDPHQAIGTTIRHNDLSGVTQASLDFDTRQATGVDIAAANVASDNTLSTTTIASGSGFDGGSANLLIRNGQATTPAARLAQAEALRFTNMARYFGTAAEPAFDATVAPDGTILLDQLRAVAGTLGGQQALIATGGAGDDIGFTTDSTDARLQVLYGGAGNDILIGSASTNVLSGDAGDDILVAGTGTSQLIGGAGADLFVLDPAARPAAATITDFSAAQGDSIVVEGAVPAGVDAVAGGYLKLVAASGGTDVMVDANGGGDAFVRLAHVNATVTAANVGFGLPATAAAVPTSPAATIPTPVTTTPVTSTPVTTTPVTTTPSTTTTAPVASAGAPAATPLPDVVAVVLSEDAYKGNAQFTVSVDGKQVGGRQTVTALHAASQTQTFLLTGQFGGGTHAVGVSFVNDLYGGSSATDRNLYVASVGLNGSMTAEKGVQASNGTATYQAQGPAAVSAATPGLTAGAGVTLILDQVAAADDAVTMTGTGATVQLTSPAAFHGTIAGFGKGDTLDLRGIAFGGAVTSSLAYSGDAASGTLSLSDGTHAAKLAMVGKFAASTFKAAADGHGGTAITFASTTA